MAITATSSSSISEFNNDGNLILTTATENPVDETRKKKVTRYMRFLTFMAAIGGFLFGYDTGVISGAMLPMTRAFELSPEEQEVVVSATIFSAAISSLFGGSMNEKFGRRPSILFAAFIFSIGSLLLFVAWNYSVLVLGRIILGMGVGVASLTTPIYVAEVALPEMRGQLVTINTLLITLGQFSAGMVDGILDELFPISGWRGMLGLAAVPSAIMFLGFLGLPESPRWLAEKGKLEEAKQVLYTLRETDEQAEEELLEIVDSLPNNQSPEDSPSSKSDSYKTYGSSDSSINEGEPNRKSPRKKNVLHRLYEMLSHAPTRKALFLGCGLMFFQQFAGVSTIMYYAASIYQMSGFDELSSVWLSGFTALAQVAGIIASTILVDRAGRRTLVLGSLGFVSLSLMGMALSFYLARIHSGQVDLSRSSNTCQTQPASVWDGITAYCYDCANIDGCGFCNGACVRGDEDGPYAFLNGRHHPVDVCEGLKGDGSGIIVEKPWRFSLCPNPYGFMSVFFMVMYLLTFGVGMSAMPWTINSEIYPLKFRSMAVSISTAMNWMGNLIVSATFLSISSPQALTAYGAFIMYASIAVLGTIWLYFTLPETKGLSLEEIESLFRHSTEGYDSVRTSDAERESLLNKSGNESKEGTKMYT